MTIIATTKLKPSVVLLKEEVQQLSARAVCCDVLFKFTVLYFLLSNIWEWSAGRLSLAPSAVAYTQTLLYRIRTLVFDIVPFRFRLPSATVKLSCCYKLDRQLFRILDHTFVMVHVRKTGSNPSV